MWTSEARSAAAPFERWGYFCTPEQRDPSTVPAKAWKLLLDYRQKSGLPSPHGLPAATRRHSGAKALDVIGLTLDGEVTDVSLKVHSGEIIGAHIVD